MNADTLYSGSEYSSERNLAAMLHLSGLFGPLLPLVCWLAGRKNLPILNVQGVEALNFHIQASIIELTVVLLGLLALGPFVLPLFYIYRSGMVIWATLSASKDPNFKYPGVVTRWIPSPS